MGNIFFTNELSCDICDKKNVENRDDYFFVVKSSNEYYKNKVYCYDCLEKMFVEKYGYEQIPYLEMMR